MTKGVNITRFLLSATALVSVNLMPFAASALPSGGSVAAGTSTISTTGSTMTVTQSTQKSIINWGSYNIANGETVNYVQPANNSISLNRVSTAAGASTIDGALNANGQVWIINQNGIIFGQNAQVNVGSLLASTSDISDANFMNPTLNADGSKHYVFDIAGNGAIIVRNGAQITAAYAASTPFTDTMQPDPGTSPTTSFVTLGTGSSNLLSNWDVINSTVDVNNAGFFNTYYAKYYTIANGKIFVDLDGTNPTASATEGGLASKNTFNAPAGTYTFTAEIGGNDRAPGNVWGPGTDSPNDSATISIVDAVTNQVLASRQVTLNPNQAFADYSLTVNLSTPHAVKLEIVGSTNFPGANKNDYQGALVGNSSLTEQDSPYITFLGQAIDQEGGSTVKAINGKINYATGNTFTADSLGDQLINKVTVVNPADHAVLVDGVMKTGIDIKNGAFLYAAMNVDGSDAPNGTVTLQSVATQQAFNDGADTNGNGVNDTASTTGPAGQLYPSSELVNIENGADIRPAAQGSVAGGGAGAANLIVYANVIPGAVTPPPVNPPPVNPPPVVTPPEQTAALPDINDNTQVFNEQQDVNYSQVSMRDATSQQLFSNANNLVNFSQAVGSQNLLAGATPTPAAGNANVYANQASSTGTPQAPVLTADAGPEALANLAPAAGGDAVNPCAAAGVANTHLANPYIQQVNCVETANPQR